jgi:hypothetical protein
MKLMTVSSSISSPKRMKEGIRRWGKLALEDKPVLEGLTHKKGF